MNLKHQNQQTTHRQAPIQLETRVPAAEGSAVTYSWYPSKKSAEPHRITESFYEFANRCIRKPVVASKDDGLAFSPFTYTSLPHGKHKACECNFLTYTIENVHPFDVRPKHILARVEGLASFVYSTRMHSDWRPRGGNYQLVVALRTPIPAEDYKKVAMHFALRFSEIDGGINSSYLLSDQRIAFPSCTSKRRQGWSMTMAQLGNTYDWLPDFLGDQAPKSSESWGMQ
jgi:hypothetical protein